MTVTIRVNETTRIILYAEGGCCLETKVPGPGWVVDDREQDEEGAMPDAEFRHHVYMAAEMARKLWVKETCAAFPSWDYS